MLIVKNLNCSIWEKKIISDLNLEVKKWELHIILWPNWSWKSTFWKVLLSHPKYKINSWEIFFEWENIIWKKTYEIAKKWIFLSHQNSQSIEWVCLFELIRASQKETWEHISLFKFKNLVKENLKKNKLDESFLDRDFNKGTSWWEQKKMEMLFLLSLNYKLAFLDEIDSWLDFDAVKIIANQINYFIESWEKSVILITHSKQIISYLKPNFVHLFCNWTILKTWWIEVFDEVEKHWYEYAVWKNCNECKEKICWIS